MDVTMPVMSGFEAADETSSPHRHSGIVLYHARFQQHDRIGSQIRSSRLRRKVPRCAGFGPGSRAAPEGRNFFRLRDVCSLIFRDAPPRCIQGFKVRTGNNLPA